jgi:hypothetical protein
MSAVSPAITGEEIRRLMRRRSCALRELAARSGFTLKRIREVWAAGLESPGAARDWVQAITGSDPGARAHYHDLALEGVPVTVARFLVYTRYSRACPPDVHPGRWRAMLKWLAAEPAGGV